MKTTDEGIEEMVKAIYAIEGTVFSENDDNVRKIARALYAVGYRLQRDAVMAFIDRLCKEKLWFGYPDEKHLDITLPELLLLAGENGAELEPGINR